MSRAPARWLDDETRREDDWPDLPDTTRTARVSVLTRGLALGLLALAVTLAIILEWADRRNASETSPRTVLTAEDGIIASVAFSADGRTIAVARLNGSLSLWDVASRRRLGEIELATNLKNIILSPDGRTIATTDLSPTVRIWDATSGKELRALEVPDQRLTSVAFSPDRRTLAAGDCEGHVTLWDLAGSGLPNTRRGHEGITTVLAFSPDGSTLASGGRDGTIRLWDTRRGEVRRTLGGRGSSRWHLDGQVVSLAFSGDGTLLASSAAFDPSVRVWDVAEGRPTTTLDQEPSPNSFVAFLPDGRALISSLDDGVVRRWDPRRGRAEAVVWGLDRAYPRLAASPDGKRLAIAEGGTLSLRELP